jgi:hypothetical protein
MGAIKKSYTGILKNAKSWVTYKKEGYSLFFWCSCLD